MDSDNNQIDDSFDCDLLDESIEEDAAALQEKLNAQNGGGISDIPTSTPLNNGSAGGDHAQGDLSSSQLASSNRLQELAEETRKIREITTGGGSMIIDSPNLSISSGSQHNVQSAVHLSIEEKAELDARSVYVGNVEYAATPIQLEEHFRGCGPIERVTILADKYSGHPKGFAYIQFTEVEGMNNALALDESLFLGRQIKVNAKRTNKPGMSSTHRPPRGGRGGLRGRGAFGGGRFGFRGRGRGGPMRGSRRFTPY